MKYFSKLELCDVWFLSGCHLIFDTLYLDLNKYISLVPIMKSNPIYIDIINKISNVRFKIYLVILVNSTVTFMLYRIFFCLMIMCQIQPCRYQWLSVIFVKEKWNINDDIDICCCSDSWVVYQTSFTLGAANYYVAPEFLCSLCYQIRRFKIRKCFIAVIMIQSDINCFYFF